MTEKGARLTCKLIVWLYTCITVGGTKIKVIVWYYLAEKWDRHCLLAVIQHSIV